MTVCYVKQSVCRVPKKISRKEEVAMRKTFFVSCALLFLLGIFFCVSATGPLAEAKTLKFSDSKNFTSEPFEIKANEWQVNWKYKAKKVPIFIVYVFPEGEKTQFIEMVNNPRLPEGSGTTYLYKGNGKYYIKVITKNDPNWEIEVVPSGVSEPLKSPASFSGTADATTKPFKIQGNAFKVSYAIEPLTALSYTGAGQMIAVYPRGEMENYIDMVTVGAGTGTKVFEGEPGEYYIKVQATLVKSWKIDVTE